jgi:hypothetical protein
MFIFQLSSPDMMIMQIIQISKTNSLIQSRSFVTDIMTRHPAEGFKDSVQELEVKLSISRWHICSFYYYVV